MERSTKQIKSYRDLRIYERSYAMALEIHKITQKFPTQERYELGSQLRRAATLNSHEHCGGLRQEAISGRGQAFSGIREWFLQRGKRGAESRERSRIPRKRTLRSTSKRVRRSGKGNQQTDPGLALIFQPLTSEIEPLNLVG